MLISSFYFYTYHGWTDIKPLLSLLLLLLLLLLLTLKQHFFSFLYKKDRPLPRVLLRPLPPKHHFLDGPPLDHLRTRVLLMKLYWQPPTKLSSWSRLAKQCFPFTGTFRFNDGQRSCIVIVAHYYSKFILSIEAIAYRKIPKISPSMYKPLQI